EETFRHDSLRIGIGSRLNQRADSHLVGAFFSAGWLTSKCQTTAHRPSVCGVMRSGNIGGTITHASAACAVKPPSRPTMPKPFAPTSLASWIERTRLTEMFFSLLPPPTEKIKSASFAVMREASNQLAKQVSQPSSLILAVSSETLSVGAYASKPH